MKYLQKRITFHLALIAEELTMLRRIVGTKINLLFIILSAIILTTMRNIAKQKKNSTTNITTSKNV
jgi:hypothetical protein